MISILAAVPDKNNIGVHLEQLGGLPILILRPQKMTQMQYVNISPVIMEVLYEGMIWFLNAQGNVSYWGIKMGFRIPFLLEVVIKKM